MTASQIHDSTYDVYHSGSRDVIGHVTIRFPIGHFQFLLLHTVFSARILC